MEPIQTAVGHNGKRIWNQRNLGSNAGIIIYYLYDLDLSEL